MNVFKIRNLLTISDINARHPVWVPGHCVLFKSKSSIFTLMLDEGNLFMKYFSKR